MANGICGVPGCNSRVAHGHGELGAVEECENCVASARHGGGPCPWHVPSPRCSCGHFHAPGCPAEARGAECCTAAAKKLVAEKDAEIADLKRQRSEISKLHDEAHADSCRAYNKVIPEKDAEIARLLDLTRDSASHYCEDETHGDIGRATPTDQVPLEKRIARLKCERDKWKECAGRCGRERVEAAGLLARVRPILADYAHHPDVAELLTDVRRFLEPDPPAAPKPKSAADTVLAHAFGTADGRPIITSVAPLKWRADSPLR